MKNRASTPSDPLDLEEVIRRLKPFSRHFVGVRPIPGRREVSERMRPVAEAFPEGAFLPIVVYQLGDAYFVIDGHHRVAVARQKGIEQIDAEITELRTDWKLPADADRALIIHVEQQRWFEEASGLEEARPDVRIKLSRTADYIQLLENVQIHGYHLMMGRDRGLPPAGIAADWYERVYAPVVDGLRRMGGCAFGSDRGRPVPRALPPTPRPLRRAGLPFPFGDDRRGETRAGQALVGALAAAHDVDSPASVQETGRPRCAALGTMSQRPRRPRRDQ